MAKYRLQGGGTIEAPNPLIAVKKLRSMQLISPESEKTDQDFMLATAERSKVFDGSEIDTSSHGAFIDSLIASGYLQPYDGNADDDTFETISGAGATEEE